jgi:hypothetical protein
MFMLALSPFGHGSDMKNKAHGAAYYANWTEAAP